MQNVIIPELHKIPGSFRPIGSMYGIYSYPTFPPKNKPHVGKYIPYMDPMGDIKDPVGCLDEKRHTFCALGSFLSMFSFLI